MTDKVRKIVLSGTILATSIILVVLQLPMMGMGLDFSFVAILLGRRYIGFGYSMIIAAIYPWVSFAFMGPIGALFLMLQAFGILTLDYWFNKKNYTLYGIVMVVLLGTLYSVMLNFFLITPMYWAFGNSTDGNLFGNYHNFEEEFLKYQFSWLITGVIFNPIKLGFVYAITYGIWIGLENSLNVEPNYTSNKKDDESTNEQDSSTSEEADSDKKESE